MVSMSTIWQGYAWNVLVNQRQFYAGFPGYGFCSKMWNARACLSLHQFVHHLLRKLLLPPLALKMKINQVLLREAREQLRFKRITYHVRISAFYFCICSLPHRPAEVQPLHNRHLLILCFGYLICLFIHFWWCLASYCLKGSRVWGRLFSKCDLHVVHEYFMIFCLNISKFCYNYVF